MLKKFDENGGKNYLLEKTFFSHSNAKLAATSKRLFAYLWCQVCTQPWAEQTWLNVLNRTQFFI
jgi:hypothetical protein